MSAEPFSLIRAIAHLLASYPHPWWIAGGWAIDLFLGQVTREHHDLEIGVFREHQIALRNHLGGWSLSRCADGTWTKWDAGGWIGQPDFQMKAARRDATPNEFDLFLDDLVHGQWQCRRCPAILLPLDGFALKASVVPVRFLRPEIQLLYKAKYHRPQDEHDFENAFPRMSDEQRCWLGDSLRLCYTDDPWLARL